MDTIIDIIENIVQVVADVIEALVTKGKGTKDVLTLKSEINTCESLINRSYSAIGRKYYEMHKDGDFDPEFEKQMREITNARLAIEDLNKRIEDIKSNS